MLVLSRALGESIIVSDRFQATVAVIGTDYVDLGVIELNGDRRGVVTLNEHELRPIVGGVRGILIRHKQDGVRLGFEFEDGVTIQRAELI